MARVLVVDDDPLVLNMLERVLAGVGLQVLTANNGLAAIRIMQSVEFDIDVLVSDVEMPEMDGRALAAMMEVGYPEIPILFISGSCDILPMLGGRRRLLLPKPFTHNVLLDAVYRLLDGASPQLATKKAQASSLV